MSLNVGEATALSTYDNCPPPPLDTTTRQLLVESIPLTAAVADQECRGKNTGGMEEWARDNRIPEADSCAWYHSTWQYLRLLNMVAVPDWHRSFYHKALGGILKAKPHANVLISAAADYGMLAMLHEAMQLTQSSPRIVLYDICRTPLLSCQWYADRHGFALETHCGNLITDHIPQAPFDLIVTDEFLTVLKGDCKPLISNRWKELLKPGGSVVTVAMIGDVTTPELRTRYAQRAQHLLESSNGNYLPNLTYRQADAINERFQTFAKFHTRHMLTGERELRSLLSCFDQVSLGRITTPGECVNPTDSFQIVASVA